MKIFQQLFQLKKNISLRITASYFFVGLLWIYFSDESLSILIQNKDMISKFQTYKGIFYIFSTSIILYLTIEYYIGQLKEARDSSEKNYEQSIFSFISIIDSRDSYTAGHSMRVSIYSSLIAIELDLTEERIELIRKAAMLHDIGKIETPDSILLKPGKLSTQEYEILKKHPSKGSEILSMIDRNVMVSKIVLYHHERWDGSGYPDGLKGDEIPLESQVIAIADTFDAMTSRRIYRNRKTKEDALFEIKKLSNIHYSSRLVEIAQKVLSNVDMRLVKNHLPSTNIEIERLSYYFKNQISGLYNRNFLYYVFHNRESFNFNFVQTIYIDNRVFIENNIENIRMIVDKLEHLKSKLQRDYIDFVIIEMDKNYYIILWENQNYQIHEQIKELLFQIFNEDENHISLYSYDILEFSFLLEGDS